MTTDSHRRVKRAGYPNSQLALFRGMDSLHRTHRDCFQLPNLCVVAIDRAGVDLTLEGVIASHPKLEHVADRIVHMGMPIDDSLSSTRVREAVTNGLPIDALVPPGVLEIIAREGLYRTD